jgi:uncharacterized membrane protein
MDVVSKTAKPVLRVFLAGVFAVLPLVITVSVVIWVVGVLGDVLGRGTILGGLLEKVGLNFSTNTTLAYALGWLVVLGAIFVLGLLVEVGAKRLILRAVDALVTGVPLLGAVYGTSKQLVGMMEKKEDADLAGMSVVFCRFGKEPGTLFLALLPTPERFHIAGADYQAVIVPTAPVPVGGGLIFVPADAVESADLSIDALMSIYVSMGVTGPQFLPLADNGPKSA